MRVLGENRSLFVYLPSVLSGKLGNPVIFQHQVEPIGNYPSCSLNGKIGVCSNQHQLSGAIVVASNCTKDRTLSESSKAR
jgi:hypothetical protein